ncbi:cutinase [Plectosphaerella plurivora]|uniref:Cutinase n=1 Tax=Plectosphaerella plurivora TaxID=936078 RepID=A0A9P9AEG0_9PEZI|nr:cutinase [Plectosphaerella plurivora]
MKAVQLLVALVAAQGVVAAPAVVERDVSAGDVEFPLDVLEAYYNLKFSEGESSSDSSLQARQYSSSVSNQLTDGTPCRAVTLIYARGTTQAGNVGDSAAVGPVFFNQLASRIGTANLAVQGVDYPANVFGFLAGGDANGSRTMAQLAARAVTQCPNTKIVLSGYSQGAQLVHNAAGQLSAAVTARITAVLTFGDPKRDQAFGTIPAARTRVICRTGDNICDGGIVVTSAHSQYQQDAPAAATWVAARVQ